MFKQDEPDRVEANLNSMENEVPGVPEGDASAPDFGPGGADATSGGTQGGTGTGGTNVIVTEPGDEDAPSPQRGDQIDTGIAPAVSVGDAPEGVTTGGELGDGESGATGGGVTLGGGTTTGGTSSGTIGTSGTGMPGKEENEGR